MANFIGATVKAIRRLNADELKVECWQTRTVTAIEFDNGLVLYPSMDKDGREPGVFFYHDEEGETYYLFAESGGGK